MHLKACFSQGLDFSFPLYCWNLNFPPSSIWVDAHKSTVGGDPFQNCPGIQYSVPFHPSFLGIYSEGFQSFPVVELADFRNFLSIHLLQVFYLLHLGWEMWEVELWTVVHMRNQDFLFLQVLKIQPLFCFTLLHTCSTWLENEASLETITPKSLRDSFSSIISSQLGLR